MEYTHLQKATFLSRPNRFIAKVLLDGEEVTCHVKNTGRCKELLVPGCTVWIKPAQNPNRKTPYSLILVEKQGLLINMDSQAPNAAAEEWLAQGGWLPKPTLIKGEVPFHHSRFDFYLEQNETKAFAEVKGVTLEQDGVVAFPDAPTQRGTRHVEELIQAVKEGYRGLLLFVVQMQGVTSFRLNDKTDPAFAQAVTQAHSQGVEVLALDCRVTKQGMWIQDPVSIQWEESR